MIGRQQKIDRSREKIENARVHPLIGREWHGQALVAP